MSVYVCLCFGGFHHLKALLPVGPAVVKLAPGLFVSVCREWEVLCPPSGYYSGHTGACVCCHVCSFRWQREDGGFCRDCGLPEPGPGTSIGCFPCAESFWRNQIS